MGLEAIHEKRVSLRGYLYLSISLIYVSVESISQYYQDERGFVIAYPYFFLQKVFHALQSPSQPTINIKSLLPLQLPTLLFSTFNARTLIFIYYKHGKRPRKSKQRVRNPTYQPSQKLKQQSLRYLLRAVSYSRQMADACLSQLSLFLRCLHQGNAREK